MKKIIFSFVFLLFVSNISVWTQDSIDYTTANGWRSVEAINCSVSTVIDSDGYDGFCQSFRMDIIDPNDTSKAVWEKTVESFELPEIFWYWNYLTEVSPKNWTVYHQLYAGNDSVLCKVGPRWRADMDASFWLESMPSTEGCGLPDNITRIRIEMYPAKWGKVEVLEWRFDYMRRINYQPPSANIIDHFGDDVTHIEELDEFPTSFELHQNYPNPFNPNTIIRFSITETSDVYLAVFNLLGEQVEVLVNKEMYPGTYEKTFNGSHLPSGVYFYRLQVDGHTQVKKMTLLK